MNRLAPTLLALASTASTACTTLPAPEPLPPPLVHTYRVTAATKGSFELRGQVTARSRVRLGFKQPGIVGEILVREGDRVAIAQVVALQDDVDARSAVRMARAARDKALRDAERAQRLAKEGALATSVSDDARSQLEATDAQLQQAEDALARARLVSPVTGTVFMRTAEPGEMVGSGNPVVILDTTSRLEVEAGASLRETRSLRSGLRVSLVRDDGTALPARIASVATTPNPQDGLYAVSVVPDEVPSGSRPGALFRVRVPLGDTASALRIPLEALVHRQDGDFVFVVANDATEATVRIRPVSVGRAEAREIEIASGVTVGEEIVAEGAYFLQDGQAVRLLR